MNIKKMKILIYIRTKGKILVEILQNQKNSITNLMAVKFQLIQIFKKTKIISKHQINKVWTLRYIKIRSIRMDRPQLNSLEIEILKTRQPEEVQRQEWVRLTKMGIEWVICREKRDLVLILLLPMMIMPKLSWKNVNKFKILIKIKNLKMQREISRCSLNQKQSCLIIS